MSLGAHRGLMIRLSIYLLSLITVMLLWRHWHSLTPQHELEVTQTSEVRQLGPVVAGRGEKLVVVRITLRAKEDLQGGLRPDFFTLLDDGGQKHRPDSLSPLFLSQFPPHRDQQLKGSLIFHLPQGAVGKSLFFHPEEKGHVPNHQSEDPGSQGGP